jgi:23S rRNA pseudouridine1911/1915/1917 synthase
LKTKIEIIYQNDDFIVINKPSGISVTKDRSGHIDLLPAISAQLKTDQQLRLIHRLDKDTSGVMMIAKNAETQSKYASAFEKRLMKKTYLALISGIVSREAGTIKTRIARSRKDERKMCADPRGKPATTYWQLLAEFDLISLLAVRPVTGRTHQIRVHMSNRGMPLAIDPIYGSTKPIMLSDYKAKYRTSKLQEEKPLIERLTLHSYQLELPFVDSEDTPKIFIAKPDKKLSGTIKMLNKHNNQGPAAFLNPEFFEAIVTAQPLNITFPDPDPTPDPTEELAE